MKHIIKGFPATGGRHCITSALKQIFAYYRIDISEAMLLGLGSGLSFMYLNGKDSPMVSGRTKVFELEEKLAQRLNVELVCKKPKNYEVAEAKAHQLLDEDKPLLIYVDMPYLSYLQMNEDSHFGGHAIALFGYDDETKEYYISDRDSKAQPIRTPQGSVGKDYHTISYEEMKLARNSSHRPFPAKNKYLEFDLSTYTFPSDEVAKEAILEVCDQMLRPATKMLGITGVEKFSKEILKWKKFTPEKLEHSAVTNYFQISHDGGTGGGIFRKLYGEFLLEINEQMKIKELDRIGNGYLELSVLWDDIADELWKLSQTKEVISLISISKQIDACYQKEYKLLTTLESEIRRGV